MLTATRLTKRGAIRRTIDLSEPVNGLLCATVTEIHFQGDNKDSEHVREIDVELYWLRRQPSDFGVAFTVEKGSDGTTHDVCLNVPGGGHTCCCKGQTYRGHDRNCRHIEAALQACRERKI